MWINFFLKPHQIQNDGQQQAFNNKKVQKWKNISSCKK